MQTISEQAQTAVLEADTEPLNPVSELKYEGVYVFEATDTDGEPVIVAFGHVPFEQMLRVANAYDEERGPGGEPPYDKNDPDRIVASLNRLRYDRVLFHTSAGSDGEDFHFAWGEGIVPVTVWRL